MTRIRALLLFAVTAMLLVAGGYLHGQWTGRWQAAEDLEQIQARLDRLPMVCGSWEGRKIELDRNALPLDETTPSVMLRYENRLDGQIVTVYLGCGRPGPMVIKHLPTECYPCAGYQITKGPSRFVTSPLPDGQSAEFWQAVFSKTKGAAPIHERLYWSWSGDGEWKTPERPRIAFAKFPWLYKLYVIRHMDTDKEAFEGSPAHDFIQEFLPELRKTLFAPRENS